ncbi:hypothetical protein D3C71_2142410 [compost metagenome]
MRISNQEVGGRLKTAYAAAFKQHMLTRSNKSRSLQSHRNNSRIAFNKGITAAT